MNRKAGAAILGGAGPFGRNLARALALGGTGVIIGSRDPARAADAARRIRREHRGAGLAVRGMANADAAAAGDPVYLAVPYAAQASLLGALAPVLDGKLVICCGVIWPPGLRPETSAAEEARRTLGEAGAPRARVAAAFQTIAAGVLGGGAPRRDPPDILVFADRDEDRREAAAAAARTGLPAVPAGPLRNARAAEAVLRILLDLNHGGGAAHAGIRITGRRDR